MFLETSAAESGWIAQPFSLPDVEGNESAITHNTGGDDVKESLVGLKSDGHTLYAFSNGTADAVETLLAAAGIRDLFDGVVSVDDRQTFKPNPDVYEHLLNTTGASAGDAWLVSSNPFDVIGAVSYGLRAAWVRRSNSSILDPWGIDPTLTVTSLRELAGGVAGP